MSEKEQKTEKETTKTKEAKLKMPTVEALLEAGVHFGHQARRWHPRMEKYIFDKKKDIHILDLYRTKELLEEASQHLHDVAARGEQIVFIGTKKQAKDIIEIEAKRCGAMYVTNRWIGGTFTNFPVIKKNIDKYKELMRKKESGELNKYTKKERLLIDRELAKLENSIGGILNFTGNVGAVFVIDVRKEKTAVKEAKRQGISVSALVDTNSDPTGIDYVVPGNDDAIRSVALVVKTISDAIEAGYKEYAKVVEAKKAERAQTVVTAKSALAKPEEVKKEEPKKAVKIEETPKSKAESVSKEAEKPAKKTESKEKAVKETKGDDKKTDDKDKKTETKKKTTKAKKSE